jgi:hypothetical protein
MSLNLFNNPSQNNVILSIGAESVSISVMLLLSFDILICTLFALQVDVFAAVRPLPSLPAGSACGQVDFLFMFLMLSWLRVKGLSCVFCLMSCSGAREAEQRCLLSRSAHYNRSVHFLHLHIFIACLSIQIFYYMNSVAA